MSGPQPGRRRRWVIMFAVAAIVSLVPLLLLQLRGSQSQEVRLYATGDRISALIVDRDQHVLVIDSNDREAAGALLGRMTLPWDSGPQIIIAGADEEAGTGLHEVLLQRSPERVLVAGLPGAALVWSAIENLCDDRGITLHWVTEPETLTSGAFSIQVDGGRQPAVTIADADSRVAISLGGRIEGEQPQVLVAAYPQGSSVAPLTIASAPRFVVTGSRGLLLDRDQVIRLRLDGRGVEVAGGRTIQATANP